MANCKKDEIIKRQIAIFREVSPDLASRVEKATGIKGYEGISGLRFNGTHNGMAKSKDVYGANGINVDRDATDGNYSGAPLKSTHGNGVAIREGKPDGSNGGHAVNIVGGS